MSMKEQEQEEEEPKVQARKPKKEGKKEAKESKESKESKKEAKEVKPKKPKKEKRKAEGDDSTDEPKKKRVRKAVSEESETSGESSNTNKTKAKTSSLFTSALNKVRKGTAVVFNTESNAPCFLNPTLKVAPDLEQWHAAKEKNEVETLMIVDITTLEIAMPLRIMSLQPTKYMNNGFFLDHEKLAFCFSQSDLSGSQNNTKKQTASVPEALKKPAKKALTKPVVQEWFFQVQDAKGHNYGMTMATFSELMQHKKIAPIEITEKNEFTMATDDDRMFLVPKEYVDGIWATDSKVNENLSDVTPAISEAFMKSLEK
jgi:hypothetical protein